MPESPVFSLEFLRFPLRYEWKLSRNSSVEKTNGLIRISMNGLEGLGEIAPNIRYDETPERVQLEFDNSLEVIRKGLSEGNSWKEILESLPVCQALKTGFDMAHCNLLSKEAGKSPAALFGLSEPVPREICYTIPVMDPAQVGAFIKEHTLSRFSWLKLKVNADAAGELLEQALIHFSGKIAIDGNEAWKNPEEALAFAHSLPAGRILFLEQPFPAAMRDAYVQMRAAWPVEVWGDESILGVAESGWWKSAFHGINVKLMKTGSLSKAVEMLQQARAAGLKTMIGCMVESSIGIAAAMELESLADYMDLDGFLLLQKEPFGLVKESGGSVYLTKEV